jgi:hypothetical protein
MTKGRERPCTEWWCGKPCQHGSGHETIEVGSLRWKSMNALQGTIKNGQVILDVPLSLPEGTRVEVLPMHETQPACGMREEDWPTTPEGIAALVARLDQVEPGWLSPEDDAAWRAALREQRISSN